MFPLLPSKNISPWISAEPFSNTEELLSKYNARSYPLLSVPPAEKVPPDIIALEEIFAP